jgi:hypothetical protein
MQILGLKKYSHGYAGCMATDAQYVFFYFAKDRCRKVHHYSKAQFRNHRHFVSVMTKFVSRSFFFPRPITVDRIDSVLLESLAATGGQAAGDCSGEDLPAGEARDGDVVK